MASTHPINNSCHAKTLLVLRDGFQGSNSHKKRIKDIEEHLNLTTIVSKLNFKVYQNAGPAVLKGHCHAI